MGHNAFHAAKQLPDTTTGFNSIIVFGLLKDDAEGTFRTAHSNISNISI